MNSERGDGGDFAKALSLPPPPPTPARCALDNSRRPKCFSLFLRTFSYDVRNNFGTSSQPAHCRKCVDVQNLTLLFGCPMWRSLSLPQRSREGGWAEMLFKRRPQDAVMMLTTSMAVMVSMMMELCCEAPFDFATFGTKPPFHRC